MVTQIPEKGAIIASSRALEIMEHIKDDFRLKFNAKKPWRIIIVGAGIAGLTAGIGMCIHLALMSPLLITHRSQKRWA